MYSAGHENTSLFTLLMTIQLNAFASGINEKTYAVTLSKGIIEKLNDEELEGVIAHELTHIRKPRYAIADHFYHLCRHLCLSCPNGSTQFAVWRPGKERKWLYHSYCRCGNSCVLFHLLFLRFGISRSREYLADAGSAEWTKSLMLLPMPCEKLTMTP